jgi:hypothetical protein
MKYIATPIFLLASLAVLVIGLQKAIGEEEWEEAGEIRRMATGFDHPSYPPYQEECGACHMAYPPGLLPAASWQRIMSGLDDHFGDNAELDPVTQKKLTAFLLRHSADRSGYRRPRNVLRSLEDKPAPLRITATRYFRKAHREIPTRLVTGNEKVKSFSNCNACHLRAEQGLFNEHDIRIPGYGRWDD